MTASGFIAATPATTRTGQTRVVSCNPGGYLLHVPGCWYATDLVWSTPGDDERFCLQTFSVDRCVGHIDEFQKSQP